MSGPTPIRFREEERQGIDRIADSRNASIGAVVRIAVRMMLGLPVPPWAREIYDDEEETRRT